MKKPFKNDWVNYMLTFARFVATFILMCAIFGTIGDSWKSTIIGALVGGVVFTGLSLIPNKKGKNNG